MANLQVGGAAALLALICASGVPALGNPTPQDRVAEARAAAEAYPESYAARRDYALALYRAGQRAEAIAEFERNAEINPGAPAFLDLALAYASADRNLDAERTYARLLEVAPDHPLALMSLASGAFDRGNTDKAIELFRRAIAAQPDFILAHSRLADALRYAERDDAAYAEYVAVLKLKPANGREQEAYEGALYRVATMDLGRGDLEQAEKRLVELIRARPEHDSAHYAYGQLLLQLGRTEEAQRELEIHMKIEAAQEPTGPVAIRGD
jgi:tetratricopeptide (TPR) repeat protein